MDYLFICCFSFVWSELLNWMKTLAKPKGQCFFSFFFCRSILQTQSKYKNKADLKFNWISRSVAIININDDVMLCELVSYIFLYFSDFDFRKSFWTNGRNKIQHLTRRKAANQITNRSIFSWQSWKLFIHRANITQSPFKKTKNK